jgi:tetratricopeptide (TPR) repeat protein
LSRDEDLARAEALIQEGLSELPNDPQYALARFDCLDEGSEVSRQKGETNEAVRRMEMAQRILRASPFDSDEYEMGTSLDLASMYSEAGRDQEALSEFQRAASLMSSLGRDETETAVVLYSNWALELDQVGRPLEAEKIYRRVIDISRDGTTEEAVSPMVQVNFARVQRQLDHLAQAADYAERAYNKAVKSGDELIVNQSLLERSRIYLAQHDLTRAKSMLAQVEPRLTKQLPPGHYAFAAISSERGLIAMESRDLSSALRLTDEAITTIQAAAKAGREGSSYLPDLYVDRSTIDLALGRADQAEEDAGLAIAALHPDERSRDFSSKLGHAYLAQARALAAEGKSSQARTIASLALLQLQGSLGPDHPDARVAQQLAQ